MSALRSADYRGKVTPKHLPFKFAAQNHELRGEFQMRMLCFAILLCCISTRSFGDSTAYPLAETLRPLTLPTGIFELRGDWSSGQPVRSLEWSQFTPTLRYGLTENLELLPLGLHYRFFKGEQLQLSAFVALKAVGQSSSGSEELTDSGINAKYALTSNIAVAHTIEIKHHWYSQLTDVIDTRMEIFPMVQLTDRVAFALGYSYRKISGIGSTNGRWAKAALLWNPAANVDWKIGVASGGVQTSQDYDNSITLNGDALEAGVNFRF